MKKMLLVLLCLTLALMMTGCATVNGNNSFQGAPNGISASPQGADAQPAGDAAQPTTETAPTSDPNAAGYNG